MQVLIKLCPESHLRFNACLLNGCLEDSRHKVICQGILEPSTLGLQPEVFSVSGALVMSSESSPISASRTLQIGVLKALTMTTSSADEDLRS